MKKAEKWVVLSLFSFATSVCIAAPAAAPQKGTGPQQQAGAMMNQKADCSKLSPDAQDFATQLSDANKILFCNSFTEKQRQSAMDLSGQMGADGNLITNDQAVEKVAKDSNMMVPASKSQGVRPGSSCPVK